MSFILRKIGENSRVQEVVVFVFTFVLFTLNDWMLVSSWNNLWKGICYFLLLYLHAQINRFFLLPKLFRDHKPVTYVVSAMLLAAVFGWILYEVATLWLYKNCYLYKSIKQQSYLYHLATMVATGICILAPSLVLMYYREQKNKARETILNKEMQLNSLRSQLNPHFLFNTFNTLYGISLQFPSRLPDLILQVSQLMRYQVENHSATFVRLQDEIAFIESYINLEKERVGHRCDIRFDYSGERSAEYKIPPALLITFVENAFKHGTCMIGNSFVHVKIDVENDELNFVVQNTLPKQKSEVVSTKIGIRNVKEQLELLYKGRYELTIGETEKAFEVKLKLKINRYDGKEEMHNN